MIKQDPPPWRIWVDTQRRIVSFHPEDGFELLEFRDQALFSAAWMSIPGSNTGISKFL